jgi:hypothetical protein
LGGVLFIILLELAVAPWIYIVGGQTQRLSLGMYAARSAIPF